MGVIKVLVAEDHLITRQGICRLLGDASDMTVIGEAGDGEEAVQMVTEMKPDVVIMDIAMPKLNGIEATRQIKLIRPSTAVLILSAYDDDEYVFGPYYFFGLRHNLDFFFFSDFAVGGNRF